MTTSLTPPTQLRTCTLCGLRRFAACSVSCAVGDEKDPHSWEDVFWLPMRSKAHT